MSTIPKIAPAALPTPRVTLPIPNDHWFYRCMVFVMLAIVFAGFGPGIVNPSKRLAPITMLAIAHGIVFLSWLLLFFTQTTLISLGQIAIHRRLGIAASFLAVAMIGFGYATTIAMAHRGFDLSGDLNAAADPLGIIAFPLTDLVIFAGLITAGILYRRQTGIHKRLMLLATVGGLMPAPLTHALGHVAALRPHPGFIVIPLFLLFFAGAAYDRITIGRFHRVSLWGAVALFVWGNICAAVVVPSAAWHRMAAWLLSLQYS